MADPTAPPWPPAQRSPEELKALAEQIARHMEDYDRRACLVNWWKCEMRCAAWVKVDWLKIVEGVIGFVDLEASPQYAAGVAEGRRQATEERTEVEYGVRVDVAHPRRKEKVGDVMQHLGEQKSRMCHDIWDGWTPVKRTVRPAVHGEWEALDEAERLRAPWKRDAEAADHG